VVCGFHYRSDVVAGRLAASALLDRLHADPAFLKDLAGAKQEVSALLAARAARPH
jgi:acid phosphatase (class A)